MMAFMENPILLDPTLLRLDNISALLALLLEGPYLSSTIDMLHKSYTHEESLQIWTSWEPHIQSPSPHSLAEETLDRDRVEAMLCMDYIIPASAAGDAQALHEFAAAAIRAEMFMAHTAVTLQEEEITVQPQTSPHCLYMLSVLYTLI